MGFVPCFFVVFCSYELDLVFVKGNMSTYYTPELETNFNFDFSKPNSPIHHVKNYFIRNF